MDKKQGLQNTFDTVAEGYDHPALSFFPETAKCLVDYLQLSTKTGITLLDVCTGTGVVALQAAQANPAHRITGIDLSSGMLAQAQLKADQHRLDNIDFVQMDLDHLNFPEKHFDHATCSFGLFFLDDMQQGLRNIASVVKPKGKIAISTFNEGAFEPLSTLFLDRYESLGFEVPPLSWKQMTTDQQLHELFSSVGIHTVDIYRENFGLQMTSADDWWDAVWNAGYRGLLAAMSETELAQFKEAHLKEVQQYCDQGDGWLDIGVAIAIGGMSE